MLILKPITDSQTISIAPRNQSVNDILPLTATIYRDGYGQTETFSIVSATVNGNFVDVDVTFTLLIQDESYYLEIFDGGNLWYRDKIYVTSQTDFKNGYSISSDKYDTYNQNENDTYIING